MTIRGSHNPLAGRFAAVVLDYGADSQLCDDDAVEISERGMLLRTRWRFSVGTELSLALVCAGEVEEDEPERFTVQGIVVWCEPLAGTTGCFESTILFWELPEDVRQHLQARAEAPVMPE